jgi:hypothetical protein
MTSGTAPTQTSELKSLIKLSGADNKEEVTSHVCLEDPRADPNTSNKERILRAKIITWDTHVLKTAMQLISSGFKSTSIHRYFEYIGDLNKMKTPMMAVVFIMNKLYNQYAHKNFLLMAINILKLVLFVKDEDHKKWTNSFSSVSCNAKKELIACRLVEQEQTPESLQRWRTIRQKYSTLLTDPETDSATYGPLLEKYRKLTSEERTKEKNIHKRIFDTAYEVADQDLNEESINYSRLVLLLKGDMLEMACDAMEQSMLYYYNIAGINHHKPESQSLRYKLQCDYENLCELLKSALGITDFHTIFDNYLMGKIISIQHTGMLPNNRPFQQTFLNLVFGKFVPSTFPPLKPTMIKVSQEADRNLDGTPMNGVTCADRIGYQLTHLHIIFKTILIPHLNEDSDSDDDDSSESMQPSVVTLSQKEAQLFLQIKRVFLNMQSQINSRKNSEHLLVDSIASTPSQSSSSEEDEEGTSKKFTIRISGCKDGHSSSEDSSIKNTADMLKHPDVETLREILMQLLQISRNLFTPIRLLRSLKRDKIVCLPTEESKTLPLWELLHQWCLGQFLFQTEQLAYSPFFDSHDLLKIMVETMQQSWPQKPMEELIPFSSIFLHLMNLEKRIIAQFDYAYYLLQEIAMLNQKKSKQKISTAPLNEEHLYGDSDHKKVQMLAALHSPMRPISNMKSGKLGLKEKKLQQDNMAIYVNRSAAFKTYTGTWKPLWYLGFADFSKESGTDSHGEFCQFNKKTSDFDAYLKDVWINGEFHVLLHQNRVNETMFDRCHFHKITKILQRLQDTLGVPRTKLSTALQK